MKTAIACLALLALAAASVALAQEEVSARLGNNSVSTVRPAAQRSAELDALVAAYPDFLKGHDGDVLVWRDGTRTPTTDPKPTRTPAELVGSPDIADMFVWTYPLARMPIAPPTNDAGRTRPDALFLKMYGHCGTGQVSRNLVKVPWIGGGSVMFTRVNGAATQLAAVADDLRKLGPDFVRYASPSAGTYNCRVIAGTSLRSMHSYGAAIDLNLQYSAYWQWADKAAHGIAPYRNQMPIEVIQAFERHGFIWGGRWADFDTMHFEYRPEMIAVAEARAGR
jgi:hypothetical protein